MSDTISGAKKSLRDLLDTALLKRVCGMVLWGRKGEYFNKEVCRLDLSGVLQVPVSIYKDAVLPV